MARDSMVMIMAGGKGSRLGPLTTHRAKPSVPFGGRYRIVDFVLSNVVNSGYKQVYVLTQYMASSLIKHLNRNWHLGGMNQFIEVVPAQMRLGEHWYRGTADAILQNLNLIWDANCDHVAVLGGDHIYKFALDQMEDAHVARDADLTIAAFPVKCEEAAGNFGVIQVDGEGMISGFQEKPDHPAEIPGRPGWCLVSMGNYFFRSQVLQSALLEDADAAASSHDFGKDVIPRLLGQGKRLYAYDFDTNRVPGEPEHGAPYWRDVGTLDSYFDANMELRSALPAMNLYNRRWRIRTAQRDYPPARFVRHYDQGVTDVVDSLVCEGSVVQAAVLRRALIGYDCFIHAGATVEASVLMSGCDVGEGARLHGVLCDKNCVIEAGAELGVDPVADAARFPWISAKGRIVLPKGTRVPAQGPVEFAYDQAFLLERDPATRDRMAAFKGRYTVSARDRHSHTSAGPHYLEKTRS